jgi:hypothetical protein
VCQAFTQPLQNAESTPTPESAEAVDIQRLDMRLTLETERGCKG